jgi:hypothetical protein
MGIKIKFVIARSFARLLSALMATFLVSPAAAIPPPPIPEAPPGAATYAPEHLANTPSVDLARELFSDWARDLVEKRLEQGRPAFYTKPKMGYVGVCEVTRAIFSMSTPTRRTDGKTYISGVAIEQLYHLVNMSGPFDPNHAAQFHAAQFSVTSALCDGLAAGTKYFRAPSAMTVSYQHHLIDEAVMKAKGNLTLDFKLDCLRGSGDGCNARAVLSGLDPSDIRSIEQRDCAGYARGECYEIRVGDWVLETESRQSTYGYSQAEPDRILVSIGLSKLPYDVVQGCSDCR